jgi:hypothetical protein
MRRWSPGRGTGGSRRSDESVDRKGMVIARRGAKAELHSRATPLLSHLLSRRPAYRCTRPRGRPREPAGREGHVVVEEHLISSLRFPPMIEGHTDRQAGRN